MRPFLALLGKQIHESKWTLFLSAAVLFGLGWLFVWVTSLNEAEIVRRLGDDSEQGRIQFMRMMGVNEDASSLSLIMASWSHPFIFLLISIWAIGRGSAAVAAEVERGTMDLLLSRPVTRSAYLASGVIVSVIGLVVLAGALMAGASIAVHYQLAPRTPSRLGHAPSGGQPGGTRPADLWLHPAGRGARPRPLASHLDRKRLDLDRVRRADHFAHSHSPDDELGALGRTNLDLQGIQPDPGRERRRHLPASP